MSRVWMYTEKHPDQSKVGSIVMDLTEIRDRNNGHYQLIDAPTFKARLKFTGFHRSRSANVGAIWQHTDVPGETHRMFLHDLEPLLLTGAIEYDGTVYGEWTYQQRGNFVGLRLVRVVRV